MTIISSLAETIASYRNRSRSERQQLETAEAALSRFGLSRKGEPRDDFVLSALSECAATNKEWLRLFSAEESAALQFQLLDAIIINDVTARMHHGASDYANETAAEDGELIEAVSKLRAFCEQEKSRFDPHKGLVGTDAIDISRRYQIEMQNALETLRFLEEHVSNRHNIDRPLREHALMKSRKVSNVALTFACSLCFDLKNLFNRPGYSFAEASAQAIYPGLKIGDLPHRYRGENRKRVEIPQHIRFKVNASIRNAGRQVG